ncbi:hypothetical protein CR513_28631, partial [Mucuna pruriens]
MMKPVPIRVSRVRRTQSGHFKKDCPKRRNGLKRKWLDYGATTHDEASASKSKSSKKDTGKAQLKSGHFKKVCPKRRNGLKSKWLDYGVTTHVSHIMQGFLSIQTIRTKKCARNLVFVSKLDDLGFNFKIGDNTFSLFKDMYYYGFDTLIDGLYCFNVDVRFMESLFNVECVVGSKRNMHDDSSTYLWHQRLGHISKERIMRLMKIEILPQLDFGDWDICLDLTKGKKTK